MAAIGGHGLCAVGLSVHLRRLALPVSARDPSPKCSLVHLGEFSLAFPLLQQRPQLIGKARQALVVPAPGALDGLHDHLAHGHQPIIGGAGAGAGGGGLGLPLGKIALLQLGVRDEVIDLGILGSMGTEAQALDALGEVGSHLPVAVDHEDVLGLGGLHVLDPGQQVIPVGVGGEALEVHDLRPDGDLLAEELHALGPVQQSTAQGALALVADEDNGAVRPPEVVLQVVADAARVAHAGSGDDDLGGGIQVQSLGLLAGLRHPEVGKVEHMGAVLHQLQSVLVEIAVKVPGEDSGGLLGQGRVNVDGEIRVGLHESPVLDLPDKVEELLGAAHGEGGDDDVSAPAEGLVNDLRQVVGIAPDLGVVAVAVGGLHDDVVRPGDGAGVPNDGLVHVADVAGEDQALGDAALGGVHQDRGAAEQVPRVDEFHGDALAERHSLAVLAGGHVLPDPGGILDGVEGLHMGRAGTGSLAVFPLGVGLLDVGGVQQHDVHEVRCETGGEDLAMEALFEEHGYPAGVVDVGVGDEDIVDAPRCEGELLVADLVPPLL